MKNKSDILAKKKAILGHRKQKCVRCGLLKPGSEFGSHGSEGGLQSYCKECKNNSQARRRTENVVLRLRHHFLTRIHRQLGPSCPKDMDSNLESYLGYSLAYLKAELKKDLKRRNKDISLLGAIQEGWHVDHITPLHSFQSRIDIDPSLQDPAALQAFKECWHYTNLSLIPSADNLAKGGRMQ